MWNEILFFRLFILFFDLFCLLPFTKVAIYLIILHNPAKSIFRFVNDLTSKMLEEKKHTKMPIYRCYVLFTYNSWSHCVAREYNNLAMHLSSSDLHININRFSVI